MSHAGSRGQSLLWALFVLLLVAALAWSVRHELTTIPLDVEARITAALEAAGFPGIFLIVNGRDVTLDGTVDARLDRQEIARVARSAGVARVVRDRLTPIQPPSSRVEIRMEDGRINLSGTVMDQRDADDLAGILARDFAGFTLSNRIEVSAAVARPGWVGNLVQLVSLSTRVSQLRIAASDDGIIVEGVIDSASLLDDFNRQAQALFLSRVPLENRIAIERPRFSPILEMVRDNSSVTLNGKLSSNEQRNQVLNAMASLLDGLEIIDNLEITDDVSAASWVDTAELLVPELKAMRSGSIRMDNSRVGVSGTVGSAGELDAISTRIATVVDKLPLENELAVIQPDRPGYFSAIVDNGEVTLAGLLPRQSDAEAIIEAAGRTFGEARVRADFDIDDMVIDPVWRRGLAGLIESLELARSASVSADTGGVRLTGVVDNPQTGDRLMAQAVNLFPPDTVSGSFDLLPPTRPPRLTILADDEAVALSGTVGSQDQADAWVDAVGTAFAGREINAKIEVNHEVRDASWLSRAETIVGHMAALDDGTMEIGAETVTFTGLTDDDAWIEATAALASLFPGLELNNLVVYDAPAREDPAIVIELTADSVTASGMLAGKEGHAIIDQGLRRYFSERLVANTIEYRDTVKAASWAQSAVNVMPALASLTSATFEITRKEVVLAGTAADRAIRDEVLGRLGTSFGDEFNVQSSIVVMLPAVLRIEIGANRLEVSGSMPDDGGLDALVAELAAALGDREIVNTVSLGGGVHPPGWQDILRPLVPELAVITEGRLEIGNGALSLAAKVRREGDAALVRQAIDTVVNGRLETRIRLEVLLTEAEALAQAMATLDLEAVQFDTGSDELTVEGAGILAQLAPILKRFPGVVVEIAGHTDSRGGESSNQRLSERRATRVKDFLAGLGVVSDRLETAGYGEVRPVRSNESEQGRARNRRIEFKVRS